MSLGSMENHGAKPLVNNESKSSSWIVALIGNDSGRTLRVGNMLIRGFHAHSLDWRLKENSDHS